MTLKRTRSLFCTISAFHPIGKNADMTFKTCFVEKQVVRLFVHIRIFSGSYMIIKTRDCNQDCNNIHVTKPGQINDYQS